MKSAPGTTTLTDTAATAAVSASRPRERRLWIDIANSPQVLVLRPIIKAFEERGWEVTVTAREFAQTLPLLDRFEIPYTHIGKHQGFHFIKKAWGLIRRSQALKHFAKDRGFTLAMSHSSNDLPVACKALKIPHVTMSDYEFARLSHSLNIPRSKKVIFPEAIPFAILESEGCTREQYAPFPGLKEEYYLADFEPDPRVLADLAIDPDKILVVLRTPPSMAAYHHHDNPLFYDILRRIKTRDDIQAIAFPRTPDQIPQIEAIGAANITIPTQVVDAQSLCYYADLVISAGGSMNREAVALGTPAWTAFRGTMGAVDKELIAEGRLFEVQSADDVVFKKKSAQAQRTLRDINVLVDLILSALPADQREA